MVHSNTKGFVLLLEFEHQWRERLLNDCLCLFDVLLAKLIDRIEGFTPICKIAWVHPHLVHEVSADQGNFRCKVDVRNDWSRVAIFKKAPFDVLAGLGLSHTLHGDPHDVNACIRTQLYLRHGSLDIMGKGRGHRLRRNRVLRADQHITDIDRPRLSSNAALRGLAVAPRRHGWPGHCRQLPGARGHSMVRIAACTLLPPASQGSDCPSNCSRSRRG
mmetsp:Transcript_62111/g.134846  ORF Transcript_62111/g.134846 Transcript_62111/m.134846 type:complete len:217 (+) Transcript_62111:1774-2424(+)